MDICTQFQTPIPVCQYMVSLIPDGCITILEPSPGIGNIVSCLKGYTVTAPKDFFQLGGGRFDCVVMNPPFSSKSAILDNAPADINFQGMRVGYYFLESCMELSDNIIALVPWFTISDSDVRLRKLRDYGLVSVTPLPRKTFQYARIQTCIIQLQKGYTGTTEFKTHLI